MTTVDQPRQDVRDIPRLTHAEAGKLATAEAEQVLALLESLAGDDWAQPTDCTEWNVRDMVAHLAGAVAGYASWAEFKRQYVRNPYIKEADAMVDGINRRQILDRAELTPAALVAEFREKSLQAVRNRQRVPWIVRQLRLPMGPPLGFAPFGYLLETIYTRDQWMHRVDIARATGRDMVITPGHDDRLVALVLRDLGRKLDGQLQGRRIDLFLTGAAGGNFSFGGNGEADATIAMDVYTFNRLASVRLAAESALAQATISGDRAVAAWFLDHCDVPY
jgi:uncharacterized protein (TIGR03083 family)